MSQENVEIARRSTAAFNRGDLGGALETAHPDVEWHVYLSPEGEVAHGADGIRAMWADRRQLFESFRWDAEEFIDAGDAVIALGELRGRAPGSDTEVAVSLAQVYWMEDCRLKCVRSFRSLAEAHEAIAGAALPRTADPE